MTPAQGTDSKFLGRKLDMTDIDNATKVATTKKSKSKPKEESYGLKEAVLDLTKAAKDDQDFFALQFDRSNRTLERLGNNFIEALKGNFN